LIYGEQVLNVSSKTRALAVKALQARTEARLAPIIKDLQAAGKTSLRAIAAGPNEAGIPTARGGEWSAVQVQRVMSRPFSRQAQACEGQMNFDKRSFGLLACFGGGDRRALKRSPSLTR